LLDAGRQLRTAIAADPDSPSSRASLGDWQRECASAITQLSGGSKQHWLGRAFSEALLVPTAGAASVSVAAIVDRLLQVLESARRSLADAVIASEAPPSRTRFASVENSSLRASLEHAYSDGQEALTRGDTALALVTFCSILETVVTDALERRGVDRLGACSPPARPIVEWPFTTRIEVAERAGLVSRGCARLPRAARTYRDLVDAPLASADVSPRDAKLARDVLNVILGDLSPGR
jgi:hypothetical protein